MNQVHAAACPQQDGAWAIQARERVAIGDAALVQRFDRGDEIDGLTGRRAAGIDAVLRDAWERCIPADAPLSLFAVGGYGRGELYPQSDVDLLVLADEAAQGAHADALARLFALLWDAGLPVATQCGHWRNACRPQPTTSPCSLPCSRRDRW